MSESFTTWDLVVSDDELRQAYNKLRKDDFLYRRERRLALPDLLDEGWEEYKKYKNNKFVGIKKRKHFADAFEDRVWRLFYNMGFSHMNQDRRFVIAYDSQNTQQIDVFAADDETVLIVECKASNEIKDSNFKKPLEALKGQMDGLRSEALKRFPQAKVKFIWATQNYIISPSDQKRMQEWHIVHFSDSVINYYEELANHLGRSARYQMLGNLFANQKIRNMDDQIPAIQGKMGGLTYYSFCIEPERLLKIGYVLHRKEANKNMMPTYQRIIKKSRLNDVRKFVNNGGYFPNSLIISIENDKPLQFDLSSSRVEGAISRIGILHLPKKYHSAYIIDGQHRLYGYSESNFASTNSIPVIAFENLDRREQLKLFMDINEKQKSVPKSLRVILNGDMLWDAPDYNDRRKALRSNIVQRLGEEETSPLLGRIVIGEDDKTDIKCITVDAMQMALQRCNFMTKYVKKTQISRPGTFDTGDNDGTGKRLYPFLEECLRYVRKMSTEEWERSSADGGILTMNRGMQALIRVIGDIVDLLNNKEIFPTTQTTEEIVSQVSYYLDPLTEYLNNITQQEREELKSEYGQGADTRFWRVFQREIAKKRADFSPKDLNEYWENRAKTFNADSIKYLREIAEWLKTSVIELLEGEFNDEWEQHIPRAVAKRLVTAAAERRLDIRASGGDANTVSTWDCATLKDCKQIATVGILWNTLFSRVLTRPEDAKTSRNKKDLSSWIDKVDDLQNKLSKSSYSVSIDDFNFIKSTYSWIKGN